MSDFSKASLPKAEKDEGRRDGNTNLLADSKLPSLFYAIGACIRVAKVTRVAFTSTSFMGRQASARCHPALGVP
jgi:hypothetical protein